MKVLLISHNSFSTHQSMGKTFLSLFSQFEKNELCQLYIYPTIPDIDVCSSYYRVTDKEVLHGLIKFKAVGSEIDKTKISSDKRELFENADDIAIYRKQGNTSAFKRILRDVMWKMSRWDNKKLNEWLLKEKPTHIFLSPGYAKFIYDIALKISKKLGIPIVTYICDDYYFVKPPKSLIGKIQLSMLKSKTDKLMKKTSHLISISEEIKDLYREKFSLSATAIMTGTNFELMNSLCANDTANSISYFGNVSLNRYTSLIKIGQALDKINKELSTDFKLNIYTAETNPNILSSLNSVKSICMCGFISGDEFDKALHSADLLLHTEAFDENSIDIVKHSISTKIADSLSSGVPLLAFGPDCVASMKHLLRHDCAFVATDESNLKTVLLNALNNTRERKRITENALKTAKLYHSPENNSNTLKRVFEKI